MNFGKPALALLLLGLVLASVLFVGGPHELAHEDSSGDCQLCFVHVSAAADPVLVVRPVVLVAHAREWVAEVSMEGAVWSASAPRAPPG